MLFYVIESQSKNSRMHTIIATSQLICTLSYCYYHFLEVTQFLTLVAYGPDIITDPSTHLYVCVYHCNSCYKLNFIRLFYVGKFYITF